MKRDIHLIKQVLERLEDQPDVTGRINREFDGYSEDELNYNLMLLLEAGVIHGIDSKTIGPGVPKVIPLRMTNTGHDLLDTLRNDTVIKQIKSKVGASWLDASFDTIVAMGKAIMVGTMSNV